MKFSPEGKITRAPQQEGGGALLEEKALRERESMLLALEEGRDALLEVDEIGERSVIERIELPSDRDISFAADVKTYLHNLIEKAEGGEKRILIQTLTLTDTLARPFIKDRFLEHREGNSNVTDAEMTRERALELFAEDPLKLSRSQWERFILTREGESAEHTALLAAARAFVDSNKLGINRVGSTLARIEMVLSLIEKLPDGHPLRTIDSLSYIESMQEFRREYFEPAEKYAFLPYTEKVNVMNAYDQFLKEVLSDVVRAYRGKR